MRFLWFSLILVACASAPPPTPPKKPIKLDPVAGERGVRPDEKAVTTLAANHAPVAIVGATLLLGNGKRVEDGTLVFENGKITAVGAKTQVVVSAGAQQIDGKGRFVTPGLIDTHSHLGVYATPHLGAHADGNEMTDPTTPYVFSEHAFWPQDPGLWRAAAGGITALQILPGSGNIIGGRAVTLKLKPGLEARAMRFPGAPYGLKMACGENPKRVYGEKHQQPMSRMGSIARLRAAFIKAREYNFDRKVYQQEYAAWKAKYDEASKNPDNAEAPGKEPKAGERNLGMETLADVLDGKIKVHIHCYRADEMLLMLSLADELGFQVSSFHHAVEAYKLADVLAQRQVGASVWADWWGFKLEAWDSVEENAAMLAAAGGRPIIHSDSEVGIQRLNQEAAKALASGKRLGLQLSEDQAIQWITLNPAWALGVEQLTGSLEVGKMADVVLWDRNPLSIQAAAQLVFVDGILTFDRARPGPSWSDFEVGTPREEVSP